MSLLSVGGFRNFGGVGCCLCCEADTSLQKVERDQLVIIMLINGVKRV